MNPDASLFHGTTILSVRRGDRVAMGGDGQVTLGNIVVKGGAKKVRRLYHDRLLAGFAGGIYVHLQPLQAGGLSLEHDWRVGGEHYARTAEAWLERMDENRVAIVRLLGRSAYHEWRVFFLACAELWGYRGGREWQVSHYRFRSASSRER